MTMMTKSQETLPDARADMRRSPRRPVGPYLLGLAVVAFVVAATAVAMRGGSRDLEEPPTASSVRTCPAPAGEAWTPPPEGSSAGHGFISDSVNALVRTSDLILIGTAQDTRVAEVIGEGPDDEFPTRIVHTTVAVEEVLRGSDSERCVVVSTDELAFRGPGIEDWRETGRRVLLFLSRSPDPKNPGVYVSANLTPFQAAYFVVGDELELATGLGFDVYGLNRRIAAMSLPLLRERVRAVQP